MVGLHAAATPGPHPEINLFYNIQQDTVALGQAEADWVIAKSGGKARVVILSHNEYAIAATKSGATRDRIEGVRHGLHGAGLRQLAGLGSGAAPAAADDELDPALRHAALCDLGRRQRLGFRGADLARRRRVSPDDVILVAADGNRSAYDRIRQGGQYQQVTASEPIELQAFQAIDELNRAFNKQPPSGFVQPPFLVTTDNMHAEGGDKNTFFPSNDYKEHYLDSGA